MGAQDLYKLIRGACHTLRRRSRENSIQYTYFFLFFLRSPTLTFVGVRQSAGAVVLITPLLPFTFLIRNFHTYFRTVRDSAPFVQASPLLFSTTLTPFYPPQNTQKQ